MTENLDINFENIGSGDYVLLVLNESLNEKKLESSHFKKIWKNAKKRILVDGAANLLMEYYGKFGNPDYICGDMDSIRKETLAFFESKISQSNIITLSNQDETDFDKSIQFCLEKLSNEKVDYFVTFWGQTGRIDHNLSCISTLIKHNNKKNPLIYLIDVNNSLSCVVDGTRKIKVNPKSAWCSIVPVGEPSKLTTTGFKWNLTNQELKFGQFISTSNEFDLNFEFSTIRSDKPVFFSMDLSENSVLI